MIAEVTDHGQSGYRKGHKCAVCREGHRVSIAQWRAAKKTKALAAAAGAVAAPLVVVEQVRDPLTSAPVLDLASEPGPIEAAFLEDIAHPDEQVAWRRHLVRMGRLNARLLDQVGTLDRLDLVSPVQLRQLEILSRLALLGFKGMSDDGASDGPGSVAAGAAALLEEMAAGEGGGAEAGGRQA